MGKKVLVFLLFLLFIGWVRAQQEELQKVVGQSEQTQVFGRNIFASRNLSFEPNLNIPTPENYMLGPGDEVIIDIWGTSENTVRETISPEGSIVVENIGPIYLSGLNMQEAEQHLRREFSKIYAAISGESVHIKVTLGKIRSIMVNVMGEVEVPGTYRLSAFASVFHALYRAGGVDRLHHGVGVDVAEQRHLAAQVHRKRMLGAQHEDVGLQTVFEQRLHRVLGGFGLQLARSRHVGDQRQVHQRRILIAQRVAQLAHRLDERQRLDVAHRTADLGDDNVVNLLLRQQLDAALDLVGDMGNDLHGLAQILALAAHELLHGAAEVAGGDGIADTLTAELLALLGHDHRSGVSRYGLWQACGVAGDLQRLRRYFFQHRSEHADGVASHCRLVRRTAFGCSGHCYRCYFAAGVFRWPQQQRNGRDF